jgi:carboxypeptidase Q
MLRTVTVLFLSFALSNPIFTLLKPQAGDSPETEIQTRIREEGSRNSQIMRTMHFLTDVYGPRLTGSPNHENAAKWTIKTMTEWGMSNAHLEPWEFGHPGWLNERVSAHVIAPYKEPLVCEVLGWTPGTNGVVAGQVVQIITPKNPTQEQLTAYFDSVKPKLKGKIALIGEPAFTPVALDPPSKRAPDAMMKEQFSSNTPSSYAGYRRQEPAAPEPGKLTPRQVQEQIDPFLLSSGATVRVNGSEMEQRRIRAFNNRTFDPTKALPTVIISNEDHGRISRILADQTPVELEFNIVNRIYPEGKTSYNAIAEIAGSDKKDEVIMLGGHLDSWHASTGATDNAVGCAVMMEAARILKAIGVQPRRTIRVALWGGEEQGLLGSQAYVREHFGSVENPKSEFAKFGGYFNIDSGTGRARGMSVFGPLEATLALRPVLAPFEDLGFMGVAPSNSRALGGSDNTSFSQAGLPGIGVRQDPIEYGTVTWHTNLDSYERIIEEDAKKSAIVIAAALYHLANRDELLPRFDKQTMPALPAQPPRP